MRAGKRALPVGGALLIILGVVVRFNVDSDVIGVRNQVSKQSTDRPTNLQHQQEREKKEEEISIELNEDANVNSNCVYSVSAFDRTGQLQLEPLSNRCLESNAGLLDHLVALSNAAEDHAKVTAVVAISVVDRRKIHMIESLGLVADEFLTPRMDWRIMVERFIDKEESSDIDASPGNKTSGGNFRKAKPAEQSQTRLLLDPSAYAPTETGTFADPFISVIHTLHDNTSGRTLRESGKAAAAPGGNSILIDELIHVDLILLRVLEEQLAAFAGALRRYQFPSGTSADAGKDSECTADLAWNQGRTLVQYGGPKDFLGAMTFGNANRFATAIGKGFPFVRVQPVQWARTYHFYTCSSETVAAIDPKLGVVNGLDCVFLPIFGGTCLHDRVDPSLKCMSQFSLGSNMKVALPRNGVPSEVCQSSREQAPPSNDLNSHAPPAKPFFDWCPQSQFGYKGEPRSITPELLSDPSLPMGFGEIEKTGVKLLEFTSRIRIPTCIVQLTGLKCGDDGRPCCWNEGTILQNVLGSHNGTALKQPRSSHINILSSFLTRFNRSSRNRIARLYHPRLSAMIARGEGWESALAMGQCATLHIRRGDNIDRCQENPGSDVCSMDLSLKDYMEKAVPMLAQLGDAKHVFVMTDDPEVVGKEKRAPWLKEGYFIEVISGHNQYSKETYSDWDPFIESLHGAQFCRAFVGHHISTVSKLVFRSICTRWGECPITDDFSGRSGMVW